MKRLLLFFLLLFVFQKSISQGDIGLPTIIPPSPEARKMVEYGNVPVSYSTGVPEVNVQLYNLPTKEMQIPIAMSYHGSGVRVGEDDGIVGLKWYLNNGGGRISRTTMGRPDEDNLYQNSGWLHSAGNVDFGNLTLVDKENLEHGCYDLQPDEFNIALPNGFNGKFVFNENAEILMIPQTEHIKIEYVMNLNTLSWEVTDLSGVKYIFDSTTETAITGSGCSTWDPICQSLSTFPTSWMLDKVIFPSGEEIAYTYVTSSFYEEKWISQTHRKQKDQSIGIVEDCYNNTTFYNKLLSEIQYKDYLVSYEYSLKDINEPNKGSKLDSLAIKYNGNSVKKFNFLYEFNNNDRMFLMSIKEVGALNNEQAYRSFEYYNKENLPDKNSFAIDHFGYYNGSTNSKLAPNEDSYISSGINNGANRLLNDNVIRSGALKNIYYPTTGSVNFEYEPNSAYAGQTNIENNPFAVNVAPQNSPIGWQTFFSGFFTVEASSSLSYGLELTSLFVTLFNETGDPGLNWQRPNFDILDVNENVVYSRVLNFEGENISEPNGIIGFNNLSPGNYRIKLNVYNPDPNSPTPYVYSVKIEGRTFKNVFYTNKYYGGLRVKKITTFKEPNQIRTQQEFFYERFDDDTLSSGKKHYNLSSRVDFNIPNYDTNSGCLPLNTNVGNDYDIITSYNPIFSEYALGSSVRYSNVKEVFIGDNEQFEIKRYFNDFGLSLESQHLGGGFLKPKSFENYALGILVVTEKLDSDNDLVQKTNYEYETLSPSSVGVDAHVARSTQSVYLQGSQADGLLCNHHVVYTEYPIFTRWLVNSKKTTINYFQSGDSIKTITKNFYDNPDHKLLTRSNVNSSIGDSLITKTFYPQDLSSPSSAETALINDYRIGVPIKQEVYENGKQISQQYTKYNNLKWPGLNLQEIVQSAKGLNVLEDRITYHSYDSRGNPIEVSKADGTHIYYIWGYQNQYPIAKIENFTSTDATAAQSLIDVAINASNSDSDATTENALRTALNTLRNAPALSNAMISTYTYNPLIGVTSITDPRGYTTYYEYDDFNRLKFVKDAEGNIVSKNEYNYKNN